MIGGVSFKKPLRPKKASCSRSSPPPRWARWSVRWPHPPAWRSSSTRAGRGGVMPSQTYWIPMLPPPALATWPWVWRSCSVQVVRGEQEKRAPQDPPPLSLVRLVGEDLPSTHLPPHPQPPSPHPTCPLLSLYSPLSPPTSFHPCKSLTLQSVRMERRTEKRDE